MEKINGGGREERTRCGVRGWNPCPQQEHLHWFLHKADTDRTEHQSPYQAGQTATERVFVWRHDRQTPTPPPPLLYHTLCSTLSKHKGNLLWWLLALARSRSEGAVLSILNRTTQYCSNLPESPPTAQILLIPHKKEKPDGPEQLLGGPWGWAHVWRCLECLPLFTLCFKLPL